MVCLKTLFIFSAAWLTQSQKHPNARIPFNRDISIAICNGACQCHEPPIRGWRVQIHPNSRKCQASPQICRLSGILQNIGVVSKSTKLKKTVGDGGPVGIRWRRGGNSYRERGTLEKKTKWNTKTRDTRVEPSAWPQCCSASRSQAVFREQLWRLSAWGKAGHASSHYSL